MCIDPWVDRGTCPPYLLNLRGRPVFCSHYFFLGGGLFVMHRCTTLITYIAVFCHLVAANENCNVRFANTSFKKLNVHNLTKIQGNVFRC